MRKQNIIILTVCFFVSVFSIDITAQESVMDGAYLRETVAKREVVPFQNIREADAHFSKRLLRMIDLDEKLNHPLYFPIKPIFYPGGLQPDRARVSLMYLIYQIGIMAESEINRQMCFKFDPNDFNNWDRSPIAFDDTTTRYNVMTYQEDVQMMDEETGERFWDTRQRTIPLMDIKSFLIWEEWVFDKQRSVMDVRIIAMAPVAKFLVESNGIEEIEVQRLFWIPFPQYRPLFSIYEVKNPQNDAEHRTYDDVFGQRQFESYVIAESNLYDNRFIRDYLLGIEAMYEGQQIEAKLFDKEQDLWEY